MADRPILFSAPMVQAILAGRKTVTRRVLKPQPDPAFIEASIEGQRLTMRPARLFGSETHRTLNQLIRTGDRLYVRETFSGKHDYDEQKWPPSAWFTTDPLWYWADGNPTDGDWTRPKPGIHMPRWASRLTLTVTEVKVERLQDITEEQARAEGVEPLHHGWFPYGIQTFMTMLVNGREVPAQCCVTAKDSFRMLWQNINGPASWDANPWVAAYTFTVAHRNIDARD